MRAKEFLFDEVYWATGPALSKATLLNQRDQKDPANTIVWLNSAEVWPLIDPNFRVTPTSPDNHIGNRMDKASSHWEQGNFMDLPRLAVTAHPKYPIGIENGRHRIAAAAKLGHSWFPAIVAKDDVAALRTLVLVNSA